MGHLTKGAMMKRTDQERFVINAGLDDPGCKIHQWRAAEIIQTLDETRSQAYWWRLATIILGIMLLFSGCEIRVDSRPSAVEKTGAP